MIPPSLLGYSDALLSRYMDDFEAVRGFRSHRLFITYDEFFDLGSSVRYRISLQGGHTSCVYDGARIYIASPPVVQAIRAWDLAP